jgi:hypothetical protein
VNARTNIALAVVAAVGILGAGGARAQTEDAQRTLAGKLVNPLASLVSVPFQVNLDRDIGPRAQTREQLNIQPVVPITLGPRWKVISRTVVPLVYLDGGIPDGGSLSGLSDVTQSLFFTPVAPAASGWLLGAGPVAQLPTGTDSRLSTDAWSLGPTAVAVYQAGAWTCGALANHLWPVAGERRREAPDTSLVQPFVGYVTPSRTTVALNAEATYDGTHAQWAVPVHLTVAQLLKLGPQPLSVFVAARYWAASPDGGAKGWGIRYGVTLLFRQKRP